MAPLGNLGNTTAMNAPQLHPPSIWDQMSYTPPRGACSSKNSYLIPCACLRFMIHPLKAPSSFECDGCGHHASFHKMENQAEEEIVRRWKAEQEEPVGNEERGQQRLLTNGEGRDVMEFEGVMPKRRRVVDLSELVEGENGAGKRRAVGGRKRVRERQA